MISETIHVSYPGVLELRDHVNFADLAASLEDAAEKATAIDILGGYYSVGGTLRILKKVPRAARASCKIRIAVGLDANVKIRQHWSDMRELEHELRKIGFKHVILSIVTGRPHFHTKLFHFLRKTQHVWFIGSANPGSDRHELMLSFRGKHDALRDYVAAVFAIAQPVTKQFPKRQIPSTLREFFLTGSLIHKVPQQALFTFDAFKLDPDDREKMMRALTSDVVPHARPKAQGFAFGLRSAVDTADTAEDEGDEAARIQLRLYTVDTILGFWAPRVYGDQIRIQLQASHEARVVNLTRFAEKLSRDGGAMARQAFSDYLSSMERFLASIGIKSRAVDQRDAAFDRFLSSRQKMLATDDGVQRLAQRLQILEMPDIWYDDNAARNFELGFFADVAYRSSGNARVVRSIAKGIGLPKQGYLEPEQLQERLARRLKSRPWKDEEWSVD
jgi:hypothetical protein